MGDDRLAQARAEARKYVRPQMLPVQTVSEHREEAFLDGWEAADANHPTAEALARVRELHRPVHPVFNWQTGLRYENPCETCWGKAGVHECGCWSDEDTEYECRGCAAPRAGRRRTPVPWPCATIKAIGEAVI